MKPMPPLNLENICKVLIEAVRVSEEFEEFSMYLWRILIIRMLLLPKPEK